MISAAAAKLVFAKQPTGGTAGKPLTPAIKVAVEDTFGNIVLTDSSKVTMTISTAWAGES